MKIYQITDEGMESLINMSMFPKQAGLDMDTLFKQRDPYQVKDGVAFIHVFGPLLRNASDFDKKQSITDYSDIEAELLAASVDPSVRYVVMKFDSPGGESIGCLEVVNMVLNFPKPVYGVVDGICASAAYKICSACTYIYSTVSSETGSIGSIIVITNTKEAMNANGIKREVFTNKDGVFKSIGHNFGDMTEEQREYIQNKVEESAIKFQNKVLENRPWINTEVFNASMYSAEKALEMGLIDYIL